MSEYKQSYRLPTIPTTRTSSAEEYMEAWRTLIRKVEKFFPGYEWAGYDPDLEFKPENDTRGGDRFTLPLRAALVLTGWVPE